MDYFEELDTPLESREHKLLGKLEQKRLAGEEVAPFPGYDTYSKLLARHDRKSDLKRFEENGMATTFGQVVSADHFIESKTRDTLYRVGPAFEPKSWLQSFNLHAKEQAYDVLRENWLLEGLDDYREEAQRHLEYQATQEAARLEQVGDLYKGDPKKAAIARRVTRQLYAEYRQYVEKDLVRLEQQFDPAGPPPDTMASETPDFTLYVKEEYREKLLPFLKNNYTNSIPANIAKMLFALNDLELLTKNPMNENKTKPPSCSISLIWCRRHAASS